ncbi:hypothetical protein DUNSADRAFT_1325 [Dunaliella salina]|uniref:Uncharacterized protein n=1 Tax=Dunaliella salina TaxID=3046 RepID=A0ABQ7FXN0_DUNSA|nr:hypothetical protein DUNSADRAFT_1325 [Dunaliella salina]|eukprot:KAF5827096.1 hypothetical protein DUNSADRAFT_1325 [Dunaliella salina]
MLTLNTEAVREAAQAGETTRLAKKVKYNACGLCNGGKFWNRTAGGCWAMCSDGFILPPFEMPDAESIRMTLLNIIRWFAGTSYLTNDNKPIVVVYDDMCHLLRFAQKRINLHPEIKRFVEEPLHCVDKFHFVHNHKGIWCDIHVNPYKLDNTIQLNTEVCEQRLKHINKFGPLLRRMRRERFNWTLLNIVEMDHKFRAQGLLGGKPLV